MNDQPTNVGSLRVIIAAMGVGLLTFTGIALYLGAAGEPQEDLAGLYALVLVALAVGESVAFIVVRANAVAQARKRIVSGSSDDDPASVCMGSYVTLTLIGGAMAEGIGLFGAVTLLITGNWLIVAAPVLALLVLVLLFPTEASVNAYTEKVTGVSR